jgi:hypothetical protein
VNRNRPLKHVQRALVALRRHTVEATGIALGEAPNVEAPRPHASIRCQSGELVLIAGSGSVTQM